MEYETLKMSTPSTDLCFRVGEDGVKRIHDSSYSPEPYCGIMQISVIYEDGTQRGFNMAYMPEFELVPKGETQ